MTYRLAGLYSLHALVSHPFRLAPMAYHNNHDKGRRFDGVGAERLRERGKPERGPGEAAGGHSRLRETSKLQRYAVQPIRKRRHLFPTGWHKHRGSN